MSRCFPGGYGNSASTPTRYLGMVWREFRCCHCGYTSSREREFKPADYHLLCNDEIACEVRYQDYLGFAAWLAEDLRQRYIETA